MRLEEHITYVETILGENQNQLRTDIDGILTQHWTKMFSIVQNYQIFK